MKPILFKNPNSFLFRLEQRFWTLWEQSFIRFLLVGGINTGLGYVVTLLLRFTLFIDNPKWIFIPSFLELDAANTVMFVLLFPVSYTLQALFAFRKPWRLTRMLLYPLTSIPNYLLQQGFIFLFETGFQLPPTIAYALSAVLPIPIMFFIIRFFVTPKSKPSL